MRYATRLSAAAVAACLSLAGCGAVDKAEQQAKSGGDGQGKVLTVSVFGGSWGEAVKEHVVEPFEKKHGVTVRTVESTSTVALGKMRQDAGVFDVALLDSGISDLAREEKLVATLPEKDLGNLPDLADRAQLRDDEGLWGVTMGFWALGIAYNTDKVKEAPDSWADLWDEQYAGKVSVPTPATTGGLPLLVQAAKMNGGGPDRIDPGFAKLGELDVAAFFDSSGTASNLLQSGEAVVAAHYNPGTWPMADQGLPVKWAAPKEGALAADSRWHVSEGSPRQDLAAKFVDFASGAEAQRGLAEDLYVAPANTTVELDGATEARMPYGAGGSLSDLQFSDWKSTINAHRAEWTKEWNKKVAR